MKFRAIIYAALLHGALLTLTFFYVRAQMVPSYAGPGVLISSLQTSEVTDGESIEEQPLKTLPAPEEAPAPTNFKPLEEIPEPVVEAPLPEPPTPLIPATDPAPRPNPTVPLIIPRAATEPETTQPAAPPPVSHRVSGGGGGENLAPALTEWEAPRVVRAHFRGRVVAVIELDAQGTLKSVVLDKGTGRRDWDDALLRALKAATYRAAREDGRDVPSSLRQPIVFE